MLSLNQRGGNVMTSDEFLVQEVQALAARLSDARASVERRFVGQHEVVEQVLASILSGGHALLIGQPGLGKTMLVDTLSTVLGLASARQEDLVRILSDLEARAEAPAFSDAPAADAPVFTEASASAVEAAPEAMESVAVATSEPQTANTVDEAVNGLQ